MTKYDFLNPYIKLNFLEGFLGMTHRARRSPDYMFGAAVMSAFAIKYQLDNGKKSPHEISVTRDAAICKRTMAKFCTDVNLYNELNVATKLRFLHLDQKTLARLSQTYAAAVWEDCHGNPGRFESWAGKYFSKYMN
ncbi:hypothetical protein ABW19_dt0204366 [Dactylella cylindrospora]|nr:hypothetical protein ABW19_dt0204366 [Dactylella cylindrospora]